MRLPHVHKVYVPSESAGASIDEGLRASALLKVRTLFAEHFGGFTSYDVEGGWIADDGSLVIETVTVIEAYTETVSQDVVDTVLFAAGYLLGLLDQESVLYWIDGSPALLSPEEGE